MDWKAHTKCNFCYKIVIILVIRALRANCNSKKLKNRMLNVVWISEARKKIVAPQNEYS
jgi:hypothetical protein